MFKQRFIQISSYVSAAIFILYGSTFTSFAQKIKDYEVDRGRAFKLLNQNKHLEAITLFKKLAGSNPSDAGLMEGLGYALSSHAETIKDEELRRLLRLRALAIFHRAQELGATSELLQHMIERLPKNGSEPGIFSLNKEANAVLREGDSAWAEGKIEKAISSYERALELDPKLYEAALFAGNLYYKEKQLDKAIEWYSRAVNIDPNREIGYRYWSQALEAKGSADEALSKLIDAIIAEPNNRVPWLSLYRWAKKNQKIIAYPSIWILNPTKPKQQTGTLPVRAEETKAKENKKPKKTNYWDSYHTTRALWVNELFAKEYANEKPYRHSLKEEAAALRSVAQLVSEDFKAGKIKAISPQFELLIKLNDAGLIEPYVLLSRSNNQIALDYTSYRQSNRDKLRQYIKEFIVVNSSNTTKEKKD
jgi:tetratricopeptide (TPR) repeat protein